MSRLSRSVQAVRTRPSFAPLRMLLGLCFVVGAIFLASSAAKWLPESLETVAPLLLAVAALLGYYGFVRVVERRPVIELFSRGWPVELLAGLGLGAALFGLVIGVLDLLGHYSVAAVNGAAFLLPVLTLSIMAGVTEELLVRAVVFRLLEGWLGSWLALAFSALLFGALHLANANATWLSSAALALEAGVLLAAAFMATRRVWLAIGVHIAWNFTQSGIFGVATSGVDRAGYLDGRLQGPAALTGGAFGPEASVVAVAVCLAAGLLLLRLSIRRGHIVRPAWAKSRALPDAVSASASSADAGR